MIQEQFRELIDLLVKFSNEYFFMIIIAWLLLTAIAIISQTLLLGAVKLKNPLMLVVTVLLTWVSTLCNFVSKIAGSLVVIMFITLLTVNII